MFSFGDMQLENQYPHTPQKKLLYTPSTADSLASIQNLDFSADNFRQMQSVKVSTFNEYETDSKLVDENFQQLSIYDKGNKMEEGYTIQDFNKLYLGQKYKDQSKKNDRFIPNRQKSKLHIALTQVHSSGEKEPCPKPIKGQQYYEKAPQTICDLYKQHILNADNSNVLKFGDQNENVQLQMLLKENQQFQFQHSEVNKQVPTKQRTIASIPFKVLDAPSLQDDFYLNLVDWSFSNILAVALGNCVYLWSAVSNKVVKFCELGGGEMVTSVQWNQRGTELSVGAGDGMVEIYDAIKMRKIFTMGGHEARVGALAWSNMILASGSRDKNILYRDLRVNQDYVRKLQGHKQEVCGLKWSPDDQQLASGGNDNKLLVWNLHSSNPISKFSQHHAAVKALAWSPHQHGLLASGGGTADKTIRFWNTLNGSQIDWMDTGSQVCNLMFSKNVNELVSTHGYSQNQIVIWKYPTMEKITDLTGHTQRVLFLSMSPDGQTIVTGAGDETLRFWNVFPSKNEGYSNNSLLVPDMSDMR